MGPGWSHPGACCGSYCSLMRTYVFSLLARQSRCDSGEVARHSGAMGCGTQCAWLRLGIVGLSKGLSSPVSRRSTATTHNRSAHSGQGRPERFHSDAGDGKRPNIHNMYTAAPLQPRCALKTTGQSDFVWCKARQALTMSVRSCA